MSAGDVGRQFEEEVAGILRAKGVPCQLTEFYDRGADIIAEMPQGRTAIQVKKWKGQVGIEAVQAVVASMAHYGCIRAMVITNSEYTARAIELAKSNRVVLWDGRRLEKEARSAGPPADA